MRLSKLPPELLLQIAQQLDRPDLWAMSLVHSALRGAAQEELYSVIHFHWTVERHPPIVKLLRTLLDRPELARNIRNVELVGDYHRDSKGWTIYREFVLSDGSELPLPTLSQAASNINPEAAATWATETHDGNPDAVIALVIAMAPNIMRLTISKIWSPGYYRFLGLVFKTALCDRHPLLPKFDRLEFVSLNLWFRNQSYVEATERDDILALFYLPRIKDLTLPIANRTNMTWPASSPPQPLTLSSLRIRRLREDFLLPIMAVCTRLESLFYSWFHHAGIDSPLNLPNGDLSRMAKALLPCGQTLTGLIIEMKSMASKANGEVEFPHVTFSGSLEALSMLRALKSVSLPWPMMLGASESPSPHFISSIVPEGLECLEIRQPPLADDAPIWEDEEILQLVRTELTGLIARATGLRGVRIQVLEVFDDGFSPIVRAELDLLRVDFDVEVEKPKQTIFVRRR